MQHSARSSSPSCSSQQRCRTYGSRVLLGVLLKKAFVLLPAVLVIRSAAATRGASTFSCKAKPSSMSFQRHEEDHWPLLHQSSRRRFSSSLSSTRKRRAILSSTADTTLAFGFFRNNHSKTSKQQQTRSSCLDTSPRNWRKWLSSLPLANTKTFFRSTTCVQLMTPPTQQNVPLQPPSRLFCSAQQQQQQVQEDTHLVTISATTTEETEEGKEVHHPETDSTPVQVHVAARDDDDTDANHKRSSSMAVLHSFTDPSTNITYSALNTSKRRFQAWLAYLLGDAHDKPHTTNHDDDLHSEYLDPNHSISHDHTTAWISTAKQQHNGRMVTTKHIWLNQTTTRQELRALWRQGRLLSDRTEVLAVYKSDLQKRRADVTNEEEKEEKTVIDEPPTKRGGFADLLHVYTDRLLGILSDEQDDHQHPPHVQDVITSWLQQNYGVEETRAMSAEHFVTLSTREQYARLQHFLDWFRANFPYYYDQCAACGASGRDRPDTNNNKNNENDDISEDNEHDADHDHEQLHENSEQVTMVAERSQEKEEQEDGDDRDDDEEEEEDDEDDDGTFLGYIYPNDEELSGKAGRTELYQCYKCGHFTRFPRYNAASFVLRHQKGRCGEYSMLLVRLLRRLGHQVRWVCDWADHVWAEILLPEDGIDDETTSTTSLDGGMTTDGSSTASQRQQRWVHLDPCEAAVDKPLLYQEWGKTQTYIVAFATPPILTSMKRGLNGEDVAATLTHSTTVQHLDDTMISPLSWMEDVTKHYTSDSWEDIWKRRDESKESIRTAMTQATDYLTRKLLSIQQRQQQQPKS